MLIPDLIPQANKTAAYNMHVFGFPEEKREYGRKIIEDSFQNWVKNTKLGKLPTNITHTNTFI